MYLKNKNPEKGAFEHSIESAHFLDARNDVGKKERIPLWVWALLSVGVLAALYHFFATPF